MATYQDLIDVMNAIGVSSTSERRIYYGCAMMKLLIRSIDSFKSPSV